ncbi:MAG: glycosyltransferase, partial [bacterium]|nr:glycosyltransferase [bacterium]
YLNQYGGGERVLECLMEMFPEAPVYTLLHDVEKTGGRFKSRVFKTSFLDFKFARRNHRWFIPFMPLAARSLNLGDKYDLIISDTAGFAKGIRYNRQTTKHICYIHTPLRYAWEQDNYLEKLLTKFQLRITRPVLNYLKNWDYKYGKRPDVLLANSKFIGKKVKEYYGRPAKIIYPPVDTEVFYLDEKSLKIKSKKGYYLAIGRILHYKRFDLVVEAFKKLGLPLKIVGSGPELTNIQHRTSGAKNIEFLKFINDDNELRELYAGARAVIFPQVEDFGLVAAEAQACGTPVIAYNEGGATEIVENGKTGILFSQQSVESLVGAVELFQKKRFSRKYIAASARRFSKDNFRRGIVALI